jgi:AraC-like DNA-binding protein
MSYACHLDSTAPIVSRTGLEIWGRRTCIPRHRHARAYAALIVSGGYEECGSFGRYRVRPGDVLLHRAFDSHLDRFGLAGAQILTLPITSSPPCGLGRVPDPDGIVRLARRDLVAASASLMEQFVPVAVSAFDWQDLLASDLTRDTALQLGEWAQRQGLAQETLPRGFSRVFGITPSAFRAQARAQLAWLRIAHTTAPLVQIADEAGFADQSHMTRAIVELTGSSPRCWRQVKCIQDQPGDAHVKRCT